MTTQKSYFKHESTYVEEGASIGDDTRIWHFSHVMPRAVIGKNCNIGQNVFIGNDTKVGDGCKIQNNVSIYEGVELGDFVFCGPSMVFTNIKTPRAGINRNSSEFFLKTRVETGASIGANATIVCGTTIGSYAFIGAGTVVNKDVLPYALMVGVPARQIGWACQCGEPLKKKHGTSFLCLCGKSYELINEKTLSPK